MSSFPGPKPYHQLTLLPFQAHIKSISKPYQLFWRAHGYVLSAYPTALNQVFSILWIFTTTNLWFLQPCASPTHPSCLSRQRILHTLPTTSGWNPTLWMANKVLRDLVRLGCLNSLYTAPSHHTDLPRGAFMTLYILLTPPNGYTAYASPSPAARASAGDNDLI